ncbi:uncharacterized protein LOC117339548 isoform X1 [Pecten maximus]|uniref:uncharacterized protein LOC117339548 isoform X1 n=1 Tax=Pecten maximus TaxID=6579 RepID=UPI001458118B|nr:uncharacterized protein LOC117339548 isoform X1 [Pecten maximus]
MAGTASDIPIKRRRMDDTDSIFTDFPGNIKRQLAIKLHDLCDTHGPALESLKFNNCNASDDNGGIAFSDAYCSVTPMKNKLFFGAIFVDGLIMISKFLEQGTVPGSKSERHVLAKLLDYIVDIETQAALLSLEHLGETELTIVLANHLFGKLATSTKYVIDKYCTGNKLKKCPCSLDCDLSGTYGDTSIGNEEVWHGRLDIIVNQDIGVSAVECDNTESLGGKTSAEVSTGLERNQQIIAQTVVFSFLQKQNQPLSKHFLFPCFGIEGTSLVIYFYDSEYDVLLQSSVIPLLVPGTSKSHPKVNLTAILVSWLAVNCKYLSSGLQETLKYKDETAGFFLQAKDKIKIYEKELKSGDVGVLVHSVSEAEDSYEVSPHGLNEARRRLYEVVWRRMEDS